MEIEYCPKCQKIVMIKMGKFNHQDLGERTCTVCYYCGTMIYLKELKEEVK